MGFIHKNFNPISVSSYIQEDSISHSKKSLRVVVSSPFAAY